MVSSRLCQSNKWGIRNPVSRNQSLLQASARSIADVTPFLSGVFQSHSASPTSSLEASGSERRFANAARTLLAAQGEPCCALRSSSDPIASESVIESDSEVESGDPLSSGDEQPLPLSDPDVWLDAVDEGQVASDPSEGEVVSVRAKCVRMLRFLMPGLRVIVADVPGEGGYAGGSATSSAGGRRRSGGASKE